MATAKRVRLSSRQFELIARALADPHRYQILKQIAESKQPSPCGQLKNCVPIGAATISHHIKDLETAGLIEILREGKFAYFSFRRDVWQAYVDHLAKI